MKRTRSIATGSLLGVALLGVVVNNEFLVGNSGR
jgi:hypothetical protein